VNAFSILEVLIGQVDFSHGSIVGYKEAFFEDPTSCLCIVMDFLDDGDLY
jgi:NIMA (never in mitosis gene a)-related kinase